MWWPSACSACPTPGDAVAVLTEEQSMLRDAARSWVQDNSPVSALRRMREAGAELGYDPAAWAEMAAMGWAGVIVPEEHGGSAFGCLAMGLILEEMGRTLTASPLLASAMGGASALLLGGSQAQQAAWLPRIAAGEIVAALAIDEGPHHDPTKVTARVENGRLTGRKTFVIEGMAADVLVVSAREGEAIELFLVEAGGPGVSRQRLRLADSRGAANVTFDGAPAERLTGGLAVLEKVLDRLRVGLAAEMLGAAVQAFETTVYYLKIRVQFGQPIGAFQSLQHRAARMYAELELTRSAVEAALAALDADRPDVPELASLAKAKAGDAFHLVSNEMVQMHGGIGMTDEHDAGLYLKRARACEAAFGGQAYHRDRYARLQGY